MAHSQLHNLVHELHVCSEAECGSAESYDAPLGEETKSRRERYVPIFSPMLMLWDASTGSQLCPGQLHLVSKRT